MKKLMIAALVAAAMGVYAEDAKPEAKACDAKAGACAVKAEPKACEACAKLNKDLKPGEAVKYCCDNCKKKCEEAAAAKKAAEGKKEEAK